MKKLISVVLALVMMLTASICATAAYDKDTKELSFNADGKFKILQINDTQDIGNSDERMVAFVKAAIAEVQPDLVVFNGDQLSDIYTTPSLSDFTKALDNVCGACEEAGVPFAATLGNHDHDRCATVPEDEMYSEIYAKYSYCLNYKGYDYFTFNLPVKSSDGNSVALNVFMMDSNNNDGLNGNTSGYDGVTKDAIEWYENTSEALNAANGGEIVPSILFQHVPVKEIYSLLKRCEWSVDGAIYCRRDGYWYTVDETKVTDGTLGEAPCSEDFDTITGQYESWLKEGNIIGAWFAHDHVNSFSGITEDGIRMGYNGGTGFRAYGNGDGRSVRVFEFDENDVANYDTYLLTYGELVEELSFVSSDFLTPVWLNRLMKVVYALFGWAINLFKD